MNLRNLYRGALVTAALGAAVLPACRMIGYELRRHDNGGVYFERIGKTETSVEPTELQQPSLLDRASAYRSALKEQSELYRSGGLTAEEMLKSIESLEAEFRDVEAEIQKKLGESTDRSEGSEASPNLEHTYKTLDELRTEYASREDGTIEGFRLYTNAKLAGGEIDQNVYDSAQIWADSNFPAVEDPVLPSMMNGSMAPERSKNPGVFKRYILDLPNGALWVIDNTLGQLDRLRDGNRTHLSEAYEKLPPSVRAAASVAAWTSGLYNLENTLVEKNVIGEAHAFFPQNRDDGDVRVYPRSTSQPPAGLFEDAPKKPTEDEPNPPSDPFFGGGSAK